MCSRPRSSVSFPGSKIEDSSTGRSKGFCSNSSSKGLAFGLCSLGKCSGRPTRPVAAVADSWAPCPICCLCMRLSRVVYLYPASTPSNGDQLTGLEQELKNKGNWGVINPLSVLRGWCLDVDVVGVLLRLGPSRSPALQSSVADSRSRTFLETRLQASVGFNGVVSTSSVFGFVQRRWSQRRRSAVRCTRCPALGALRFLHSSVPRTFPETNTSFGSDKLNNSYGNSSIGWGAWHSGNH